MIEIVTSSYSLTNHLRPSLVKVNDPGNQPQASNYSTLLTVKFEGKELNSCLKLFIYFSREYGTIASAIGRES